MKVYGLKLFVCLIIAIYEVFGDTGKRTSSIMTGVRQVLIFSGNLLPRQLSDIDIDIDVQTMSNVFP